MKKHLLSLLLLSAVTLLTSCSSGLERIGLQVHLIKLERKADGSLLASLQFSNPNVTAINLSSSTHQLTLDGKPAGVIEIAEPLGLPAQTVVTTTAPLPANMAPARSGTISYQLASSMTLRIYDNDTERYKSSTSGTVTWE